MKPVVLVGLPGAGKTTIGRKLARHLRCKFHDTDHLIETQFGNSIAQIFEQRGEDYFRQIESDLLSDLLRAKAGIVIAAGGGIVKHAANRQLIADRAIGVHVSATPAQVWRRLRHDTKRPLLRVSEPLAALERLYAERIEFYREVATLTVDGFSLPLATVVANLARSLKRLVDERSEKCHDAPGAVPGSIASA